VPELAAVLRQPRERLLREQNPGLTEDWVFPSNVGTLLSGGILSSPINRAAKVAKLGRKFTPHGLRRTLNTLALQVAPSETIRKVLGHTTSAMTAHWNAPDMDATRNVLGQVVQLVRAKDPAPISERG
jgi:integrase